ncbi:LysE family translocator [Oharaeibacter diazotrophicus]|uniref:Threonine/homoserine/homoserine lactone efflux protein n=1 Tax=Oharaeibacter diazotrophicus TaxID=1920512 RepID=A0A4R6RI75_9HYPH|nr:LysE family translocator [Oharaeibacter diazotrophicus]TDP85557.1 threonine/homoserine/homoserine lactone efflux protein [Oharaeibacter diazotrophicus]BBE74528.1 homoserine/homoserine lactone efflux protein [Pleomorphomonas sp. SM30]GLS75773.1 amino acid transporter [Oharaeibacter diazotrophicus]
MTFLPDWPTLATFTVAVWLLAATPGPDMTLSVGRAIADGKGAGMMVVLGTSTGIVLHTLLVAFGVSALIVASPTAFTLLKTGGAAYLVWLAIGAIRHGSTFTLGREEFGRRNSMASNYLTGLWVNLLNPKVVIFVMTFLPQFVDAADPHVTGKLIFLGLWMIVMAMPFNAAAVLLAERLAGWLQSNRRVMRAVDYVFAGVFSLFAVKVLTAHAR